MKNFLQVVFTVAFLAAYLPFTQAIQIEISKELLGNMMITDNSALTAMFEKEWRPEEKRGP